MTFSLILSDLAPLFSFMVALGVLALMLSRGWAGFALDQPNQRSLHAAPVPRTGGVALIAGAMAGWFMLSPPWLIPILGLVGLLLAVSLWDDVHGLSVKWRLLVHAIAAGAFVYGLPGGGMNAIGMAAAVFVIVWTINLYNFMDGSDGLAGGMALIGFGCYGLLAWMGGDDLLAWACFSIAAAAGAFLIFNFHPARIFMGDAGSIPLGFLAAALGILGWERELWALWLPLLVFSPFVVDASVTLLKRLLRGEKVWQAHREHYYQRLVQMGLGHRNTALLEYGVMLAAGLAAWWGARQPLFSQVALLMICGLVYLGLMVWIDVKWKHFSAERVARG